MHNMENQNNCYSVSDLAAKLEVPRTTINDWLKKFDRYIDFEVRGRRKVYTEASLDVLKIISAARDKGLSVADLEKELAAKCAVRPEISPLTDVQEDDSEKPSQEAIAQETLPALANPDIINTLQQVFERCGKDLENQVRSQEHLRRRGFTLVAVLLVLLLIAACATLLLMGQLLTLKESSKALELRLAASKEETQLLRQSTRKEFSAMAAKVEQTGRAGTLAVSELQEKLSIQRLQFEKVLAKLEQADARREKEFRRLEKVLSKSEADNSRLKKELADAVKKFAAAEKSLTGIRTLNNTLKQSNAALIKEISKLKQQNMLLDKKLKEEKSKKTLPAPGAADQKNEEIKK